MSLLSRHWSRIAVTLIPLVFALLHALGVMPIGVLQRLDDIIYDARLRWTMPETLDERIVIVDIDEKSLAEVGRWPWGRNHLAELVDELFERQKVALVGFDVVFAEPDDSSGLKQLRRLAQAELKDQPGFAERLNQLQGTLDYDSVFARSLRQRPGGAGLLLHQRPRRPHLRPAARAGDAEGEPARPADQGDQLERLRLQHRAAGQGRADERLLQHDRRYRMAWSGPFRCWQSTGIAITNR